MLVGVVRTFRFHVPVFGYRSLGCSWSIVRVHPRPFCRIPQRNVRSDLDPDLRVLRQVVVQRRLLFAVHLLPRPSDDRFLNQLVAELDRLLCLSFVLPVEEDRQNCQAVYADRSFVPSLIPLAVYSVPFSNVRFNQRRSEEHTSELQSRLHLVCRLLLEKKKKMRENKPHVYMA